MRRDTRRRVLTVCPKKYFSWERKMPLFPLTFPQSFHLFFPKSAGVLQIVFFCSDFVSFCLKAHRRSFSELVLSLPQASALPSRQHQAEESTPRLPYPAPFVLSCGKWAREKLHKL